MISGRIFAVLLATGLFLIVLGCNLPTQRVQLPQSVGESGTYLFCHWNVENFYDDEDDPKNDDKDENFYPQHPDLFKKKVENLATFLLKMHDGYGPDILSCCEVESELCLIRLMEELNSRLEISGKSAWKYQKVVFRPDNTGRRFAPGFITRVPVIKDRTEKFGPRGLQRTLKVTFDVNDHELTVIASHWTSRVTSGGDTNRTRYADACYGRFNGMFKNDPDVDAIVCGDFNDEFIDASLQGNLHASKDPQKVIAAKNDPLLFDLTTKINVSEHPQGTIYGEGHFSIFDHICVSRGMLDNLGWKCVPESIQIFAPEEFCRPVGGKNARLEPRRFNDPKNKGTYGYSDHWPVTMKITVEGTGGEKK